MTSDLAVIRRDWSYPIIGETRSSLENPQSPLSYPQEWLLDRFIGGRTDSGIRVSELTAFQTTTFLACIDLIAGKISALPRHVYERTIGKSGRQGQLISYDHAYYDLINLEPNDEMNGNVFIKAFLCHCLAWGNGYAELQRDVYNNVVAMWPRNPAKTKAKRLLTAVRLEPVPWRPFAVNLAAGTMVYETTDHLDDNDNSDLDAKSRAPRFIPVEDMLHVPGLTFDGRVGQSVVWLARQTIGLALATEKFGAKYFANFARPGGMLMMPANLSPEQKEQARRSWQESQGGENANKIAVMPVGWEWKAMTHNPEEAQTIETRKFSRNEICSIFHVPPHMVGDVDKGRSNTEQLAQELKEYCFDPWISGIKIEFKRKLFPHRGIGRTPRSPYYVDFDLAGMLRPDAASREKYNASMKQWGYGNTNDVRAYEGLNPVDEPWAEEYWMPVNMTLVTTPLDPTFQDGAGIGDTSSAPKKKKSTSGNTAIALAYSRLFHDAFIRLAKTKHKDLKACLSCLVPVLFAIRDAAKYEAEQELGCQSPSTEETDKLVAEYIKNIHKRAPGWTADESDGMVAEELDRAITVIRVAAFREVAAARAKE